MTGLGSRAGLLAIAVATSLVIVIGLAAAGTFASCGTGTTTKSGRPSAAVSSSPHGAVAHATARAFARNFHPRVADSWEEIKAREFIAEAFRQYGFFPRTQEFIVGSGKDRVHSANVIALKEGDSPKRLVVGAHYDSVAVGEGYSDNATGVGLLLEVAARVKGRSTPYSIEFVAFGAEEPGSLGARHYWEALSGLERKATMGMIDLDAVAGGDEISVASRFGSPAWLRNDALSAADSLGVPLTTSPEAPGRPAGIVWAPTDDLPFAKDDLATVVLSAVSWENSHGKHIAETSERGFWHSPRDTVTYLEKTFPGRVRAQLADLSLLLETLLTSELKRHP